MKFREWWYSIPMEQRQHVAKRLETSRGYLDLLAGGFRRPGESLCIRIERESCGSLTVEMLRPDVPWHVIRGCSETTIQGNPRAA